MASTHENYIPVELLLKIFLPQPVKSLLRFRCVCKLWNQVITSSSFIKSHLDHQKIITTANKYLLRGNYKFCSVSFIDSQSNNFVKSHNCNMIHCIFGREPQYCLNYVYGICNGLVCMSDCDTLHGSVFLWNPIVNKVKKLPRIGFQVKHAWHTYLCFGYQDDDYKVIKVAPFPDMYHVYVYSLSTDCWEFHKFDISHDGNDGDDDDVVSAKGFDVLQARLVNGVAYFVKKGSYSNRRRVVSFDLSCEITREIDFPEDYYENFTFNDNFTLAEYEESIALIGFVDFCYDRGSFYSVMMWVLRVEPSDNSFSWDRKYTIESEEKYYFQPKDFIYNEKQIVIMRIRRDYKHPPSYFLYNVNDADSIIRHRFRILKDEDEDEDYGIMDDWGMLLEENLVLLDETTIPPFVETQSCSVNVTGRGKKELNEDRLIHRRRITKEATRRTVLSNKFKGISI